MLHDETLAYYWWINVFNNASHVYSRFLVVHIGIAVATIMLIGVAVETVRKWIEVYFIKVLNGYLGRNWRK